MQNDFMREKPVLALVLSMSLPMTLSMLVNSLYNIVDSYFVARISEEAMTALSLVYPLQILTTAVGVGLGIGLNAVASFYLGAKQNREASCAASVGVILSIVHGILLTVFCILAVPRFLRLFTQNPVIIQHGLIYSYIVFSFCVPHSLGIAFEKIFQAQGQMMISMISMLGGCIANIVLDPILIFGTPFTPAMGITGAAVATGIGQTLPILIYLFFYWTRPLPIKLGFRRDSLDGRLCRKIYAVGVPAAITIALPSVLITVLNGILASFSQTYVLILGIYYKLQTFIYLTTSGVVQGIRPIIGYNYGAEEYARVRAIFSTALKLTLGVMTIGTVICLFFSDALIGLFTSIPDTIQAGGRALRMISCGFIVSAVSVTISGTLEGLGRGMDSLKISLLRYGVTIIPLAFFFSRIFGVTGVWCAFGVSEALTSLAAVWIYRRVKLS
ncbi:MAG: MATE family efflux transporter [Lachnospiraceae bacterium]|nr:MATE family efflux transporter [Lachnospiraceae bacterium]